MLSQACRVCSLCTPHSETKELVVGEGRETLFVFPPFLSMKASDQVGLENLSFDRPSSAFAFTIRCNTDDRFASVRCGVFNRALLKVYKKFVVCYDFVKQQNLQLELGEMKLIDGRAFFCTDFKEPQFTKSMKTFEEMQVDVPDFKGAL